MGAHFLGGVELKIGEVLPVRVKSGSGNGGSSLISTFLSAPQSTRPHHRAGNIGAARELGRADMRLAGFFENAAARFGDFRRRLSGGSEHDISGRRKKRLGRAGDHAQEIARRAHEIARRQSMKRRDISGTGAPGSTSSMA